MKTKHFQIHVLRYIHIYIPYIHIFHRLPYTFLVFMCGIMRPSNVPRNCQYPRSPPTDAAASLSFHSQVIGKKADMPWTFYYPSHLLLSSNSCFLCLYFWKACVDSRYLKPTQRPSFFLIQEENFNSSISFVFGHWDVIWFSSTKHTAVCLHKTARDAPGLETGVQHNSIFITLCLHLLPSAVLSLHKPLPTLSFAASQNQMGKLLPDVCLWLLL